MPKHAYIVASRTPVIVSGSPAEPGAVLDDFDIEQTARHLESGAVVRVEVEDPEPEAEPVANAEPDQGDEQDGAGETGKPKTSRRRRTTPQDEETLDA
jgi:hypothetical protein